MFDLRQTLDLIEEGAFDEAADALERTVAQMPAYTPAYVLLAQTYEAQERWPEALEAWQRARFFAPNSPTVQAGLMRALDHQDIVPDEVVETDAPDADSPDAIDQAAAELIDTIRDEDDTAAPPSDSGWGGASPADETNRPPTPDADAPESAPPEPAAPSDETEAPPPEVEAETDEASDADEAPSVEESSVEESDEAAPSPVEEDASDADREQPDDTPDNASPAAPSAEPRPSPLEELARQLPDTDQPLPDDLQDLDRLIDELEGARIDPQPDVSDAPEPDLDNDIDDMVSETLARIYISQKQFEEAARVYLRLASQDPDQAKEYMEKAAELRDRARDSDVED